METLNEFLESSSIHGLSYIRGAKSQLARTIWILVVLAGFSVAGKVIYDSFQSWDESAVVSSVKTKPITQMKFPQVTVCPPQNSNTALNSDFTALESKSLDNETRTNITELFINSLYKAAHDQYVKLGVSMFQKNLNYYMSGTRQLPSPIFNSHWKSLEIHENIGGMNGSIEGPRMRELTRLNISLKYIYNIELPRKASFENVSSISYLKCEVFSVTNGLSSLLLYPPKWSEHILQEGKGLQMDHLTFDYRDKYNQRMTVTFQTETSDKFSLEWSYLDSEKNVVKLNIPPLYENVNALFIRWMKIFRNLCIDGSVGKEQLWESIRTTKTDMIIMLG